MNGSSALGTAVCPIFTDHIPALFTAVPFILLLFSNFQVGLLVLVLALGAMSRAAKRARLVGRERVQ